MYRYTDKEIKEILKSIIIIADTRENENSHITKYFDKKKIQHESLKLEHGDYTAMIPANHALGIMRDLYFNNIVTIERKGSLEELSGNLTQERERFKDEMTRKKGRMYLMVEGASYEDVATGNYKTGFKKESFIASLMSFQARYDLDIRFISKLFAGQFIYYTLKHHVRVYFDNL